MVRETTQFIDSGAGKQRSPDSFSKLHMTMHNELRELGVDSYDFLLPETHALPSIIHAGEQIIGIVYGRYKHSGIDPSQGRGALVATTSRILLIDKKPMFLKCDELSYSIVSGISHTRVGLAGTITLHTRAGDIQTRTFNKKCADTFVAAIETVCFKAKS